MGEMRGGKYEDLEGVSGWLWLARGRRINRARRCLREEV